MSLTCEYCKHEFIRVKNFDDHCCPEMKKIQLLDTNKGKAAFYYYKEWLKFGKRNVNITAQTFLNSRYFSSFIKFINFSNRMMLPDKISYIKHMVSFGILPIHWNSDGMYVEYIKNLDQTYTPLQQAQNTKKTVMELASIFECDTGDIFDHLEHGDFFNLLKSRKLSPWVILFSSKFRKYLVSSIPKEIQMIMTQTIINPTIWTNKFKTNPKDVEIMKTIVIDLKL